MLREIELNNFKCFGYLKCPLRPITVLAGLNGSGKSSVIQSLLCSQEISRRESRTGVAMLVPALESIDLGCAGDIAYRFAETDGVSCRIVDDAEDEYGWRFSYAVGDRALNEIPVQRIGSLSGCASQIAAIRYLSASRIGPRSISDFSEADARLKAVGPCGETAASCLAANAGMIVPQEMLTVDEFTPGEHYDTLVEQASAWLRLFTPSVYVSAQRVGDGSHVELRYAFANRKPESQYRPENVGVGLSIVLPLVVMLLTSKKGDVVILENPEAELHPKGQAIIAQLIARAASFGIQVIVETHSDHIINGLRLAVKKASCRPADVNLLFFKRHTKQPGNAAETGWQVSTAENLTIDSDGALSNCPRDFMEQWALDTDRLMDFGLEEDEGGDESGSES